MKRTLLLLWSILRKFKTSNRKVIKMSLGNVLEFGTEKEKQIIEACKEHTNFTPEKIKEENLAVIKVSEISFDFSDMSCQPRTESINKATVRNYYNQAINGFEGNFGIRTPIKVAKCPLKDSQLYRGLCGHHRFSAAEMAEYTYLICEIVDGFFDLPEEDQINLLMEDNHHANNGMRSDRKSILGNLSRTLGSQTYMSLERTLIKEYHSFLALTLEKEQEDNILKKIKDLENDIKSDLRKRINVWTGSSLSSSNVSTIATQAYNNWNNSENTKIHIPRNTDIAETMLIKYMKDKGSKVLSKRFGQTITNNRVDRRQISGEIAIKLKEYHDKNGTDPEEFILAVHLSGASSIRKLLEMRIKLAKQITDHVNFIRPGLKSFKVIFYGQIKTKKLYEDDNSFYSLEQVTEKLETIKKTT